MCLSANLWSVIVMSVVLHGIPILERYHDLVLKNCTIPHFICIVIGCFNNSRISYELRRCATAGQCVCAVLCFHSLRAYQA